MSTEIVVFRLTGIRPLLVHNPASMIGQAQGPRQVIKDPPEVMAKKSLYLDEQQRFVFPCRGIRACFMQGAKKSGLKAGRTTIFQLLSSTFFIQEPWALILDPATMQPHSKYEVYISTVVIGKARIVSGRAMFTKWAIRIPVELDNTQIQDVKGWSLKILNIAGKAVGIGDDRILNVQTKSCGEHGSFTAEIET